MKYELPPDNRNRPNAELLADMRRVARELGQGTVGRDVYDQRGRFHPKTIVDRFGSWNEALAQAGLRVSKRQSIPSNEFVADLQRVAALFAPAPLTQRLYVDHGDFSYAAVVRRFRTWPNALTAAGLDASHIKPEADVETLFANLENVWQTLGRVPKRNDMREPISSYSGTPYVRLFKTWRRALEAFVEAAGEPRFVEPATGATVGEAPGSTAQPDRSAPAVRQVGWRLRFLVMRRDHFRCRKCGRAPANEPSLVLHVDHVVPWSSGGDSVYENLQTLCEACNIGKGTLSDNRAG